MENHPSIERLACVAPGQWLYLWGNEGALYNEMQRRFAGLDAAGTAAFRAFDAGAALEELCAKCAAGGVSPQDSLEEIYALARGVFPGEPPVHDASPEIEPSRLSPIQTAEPLPANLEIGGIPIRLEVPADSRLDPLCRDYFRHCTIGNGPALFTLAAVYSAGQWSIRVNGRISFSLAHEEQIGLGLMHAARSLLYSGSRYHVAFHAAMVANSHCGLLLSAPREFGKSTLAAHLITRGFDLLADEPALLDLGTASLSALPLPISLKERSWPLFAADLPQLASSPVHVRSDGTRIRLLHAARPAAAARRLTHILFPHYLPSSPPRIEPVSPLLALQLLNQSGMQFAKDFARCDFESFLHLLADIPTYKMTYASLDAARTLLDGLGCLAGA